MIKMWRHILILVLCFVTVESASGCSNIAIFTDTSDYQVASYNVVWTECKREIKKKFVINKLSVNVYYKIENVPIEEYIACKWRNPGLGADSIPVLMKHKDHEGDLELNKDHAKLYFGDVSYFSGTSDDWLVYGQKFMKEEVSRIDPGIAEEIINGINNDLIDYESVRQLSDDSELESICYLYDNNRQVLRVTFPIKEYDNLFFVSCVTKYDDRYYLEIIDGVNSSKYLPCGEELTSVIESVMSEYEFQ